MRIVVTGATGTVGTELCRQALAAGHAVVAADLERPHDWPVDVDVRAVDATEAQAMSDLARGADAVVHLAAIISPGEPPYLARGRAADVHTTNVLSSFAALLAAARNGIDRVCLASSINAVGMSFSEHRDLDYLPLDEDHPVRPADEYSLSKAVLELQAEAFARRHPTMRIACLRLAGVAADLDAARARVGSDEAGARNLWGWTSIPALARTCLASLERTPVGAHPYFVVGRETTADAATEDLLARYYPGVPLTVPLAGRASAYDCSRAVRDLGWDG